MITAHVGNLLESIEKYNLDGIQNAANAQGPMGSGIAGAIRKYAGQEIQEDAIAVCSILKPEVGTAYSTIAGSLPVKRIIHAVTMQFPGGHTTLDICESAFKSALILAKSEGITTLGCTALGTGVGGMNSIAIAKRMMKVAAMIFDINIVFIDFDVEFIANLERNASWENW
jgi:O-acetyl-ADP-ribose deacetylase (regulator of RNase III)